MTAETDDQTRIPAAVRNQVLLGRLVSMIPWSVLFTLAYAQSPLFTSNQNQYFLHGLAKAGFGYLGQDWLANTLDPTPVFSSLVYLTARLVSWLPIFYAYYALLAGVYLFSLYGILAETFKNNSSQAKRWLTLTTLVLFHSAALRYFVVRIFDPDWAYLFDGGIAGQRLLGSVLQPSAFGVLLLLSIYLYLRGKVFGAVICTVLAPTVHPTYLLSAAVLTLVYMGITLREKRDLGTPLALGGAALLGVIPILVHVFLTFGGTDPDLTERSRELLVGFRIPHHAIPAEWFDATVFIKTTIILLALYLVRRTTLFHILFWPFVVGAMGTLVQIISGSDVLALLFPWRVSTWLVPISLGVVLFWALARAWPWLDKLVPARVTMLACMVSVLGLASTGLAKSIWEYREKQAGSDRPMMAYVSEHKATGDVYLIPLDMQDFRLETGVPAYVEFKSIPYQDVEVLEWHRRVRMAGSIYNVPLKRKGCEKVAERYLEGVTHIVLPYDHIIHNCSNLEVQYSDENYEVYMVRGE